ncbi:unnamed protein product [Owenia fusiformis]|uniref:Uncharacterized protein n=1 Tax=Owenia fusiformis TaxID=6347 RepID=A0A8J1T7K2_OWEFU|nr:unnamed protein product [Owenia fusiformis]
MSMEQKNGRIIRHLAHQLLKPEECKILKTALKHFRYTGSVPFLCTSLKPLIRTPEHLLLLVELSFMLPTSLQDDFNKLCSIQYDNYERVFSSFTLNNKNHNPEIIAQDSSGLMTIVATGHDKKLLIHEPIECTPLEDIRVGEKPVETENKFSDVNIENLPPLLTLREDTESSLDEAENGNKDTRKPSVFDVLKSAVKRSDSKAAPEISKPKTWNFQDTIRSQSRDVSLLDLEALRKSLECLPSNNKNQASMDKNVNHIKNAKLKNVKEHNVKPTSSSRTSTSDAVAPSELSIPTPRDEDVNTKSDIKKVVLSWHPGESLGFSIRGGRDLGTGIYISSIDSGGYAQRKGLRVGDRILRVNNESFRFTTHEEAVAKIRDSYSLTLYVSSAYAHKMPGRVVVAKVMKNHHNNNNNNEIQDSTTATLQDITSQTLPTVSTTIIDDNIYDIATSNNDHMHQISNIKIKSEVKGHTEQGLTEGRSQRSDNKEEFQERSEVEEIQNEESRLIVIDADADGYLGCSIRGGIDFGLDVIISHIDYDSPAWRAGIKKRDIILEMNDKDVCTMKHLDVVTLATSEPQLKLLVRSGVKKGKPAVIKRPLSKDIEPKPDVTEGTLEALVPERSSPPLSPPKMRRLQSIGSASESTEHPNETSTPQLSKRRKAPAPPNTSPWQPPIASSPPTEPSGCSPPTQKTKVMKVGVTKQDLLRHPLLSKKENNSEKDTSGTSSIDNDTVLESVDQDTPRKLLSGTIRLNLNNDVKSNLSSSKISSSKQHVRNLFDQKLLIETPNIKNTRSKSLPNNFDTPVSPCTDMGEIYIDKKCVPLNIEISPSHHANKPPEPLIDEPEKLDRPNNAIKSIPNAKMVLDSKIAPLLSPSIKPTVNKTRAMKPFIQSNKNYVRKAPLKSNTKAALPLDTKMAGFVSKMPKSADNTPSCTENGIELISAKGIDSVALSIYNGSNEDEDWKI